MKKEKFNKMKIGKGLKGEMKIEMSNKSKVERIRVREAGRRRILKKQREKIKEKCIKSDLDGIKNSR